MIVSGFYGFPLVSLEEIIKLIYCARDLKWIFFSLTKATFDCA